MYHGQVDRPGLLLLPCHGVDGAKGDLAPKALQLPTAGADAVGKPSNHFRPLRWLEARISKDFQGFSRIFKDFQGFRGISWPDSHGLWPISHGNQQILSLRSKVGVWDWEEHVYIFMALASPNLQSTVPRHRH